MELLEKLYHEIDHWFSNDGPFSHIIQSYEIRPTQVRMARFVARTLIEGKTGLVEAGTGTGKTIAYLLAPILLKSKAIVSTGTIALQEQLIRKDIPLLQSTGLVFQAGLLKGRKHYLCRWKLNKSSHEPILDPELRKLYTLIHKWAKETSTGDREELGEYAGSPYIHFFMADRESCPGSKCPLFHECFLYEARKRAHDFDILIVNHHLLFSDLYVQSRYDTSILPDRDVLILDEAHVIEDDAISSFTTEFWGGEISRYVNLVDELVRFDKELSQKSVNFWTELKDHIFKSVRSMYGLMRDHRNFQERIEWREIPGVNILQKNFSRLYAYLEQVKSSLKFSDEGDAEIFRKSTETLLEKIGAFKGESEDIRFIEYRPSLEQTAFPWVFMCTPLRVDEILHTMIWPKFQTVLATSATLTVRGRFDYFLSRTGLLHEQVETLRLSSPFHYTEQCRLWIPPDLPEPGEANYLPALLNIIKHLIELVNGRTLILTTTRANMEAIYETLRKTSRFPVHVQGEASKRLTMETFRTITESILVATMSFWQGFDVPGESLSCVIIDKIPFDVPGDPVVRAHIERLKQEGQNPFFTYQIPRAVLHLRQGFGRLIRHRQDIGILALCDSRIWKRQYGRIFLQELAQFPVVKTFREVEQFWKTCQQMRKMNHSKKQTFMSKN